jgi:hypothetical protein
MAYLRMNGLTPRTAASQLGQSTETPELRPLPWAIERKPDPKEVKREARREKIAGAGTYIAVIGGLLGIWLSLRALKS